VLFGPKVTAILLFPPNVMVGLELRVIGYIGTSFEYGVFPQSQEAGGYNLKIKTWSAGLRWYPWAGAFFVGAVLGNYDVSATQAVNGTEFATLQVKSMYLGPQIGWKWAWDFGLFLGLNLGYGFSLDYQSTLTQPPLASSSELKTAQENADKYLKTGVPILTLLELGWLF
jgi:outer membrane receptor protein involved in Fe transport